VSRRAERTDLRVDRVPRVALRPEEAALAIGVSRTTLDKWTAEGRVPHFRRGGVVLYPVDDLKTWVHEEVNAQSGGA